MVTLKLEKLKTTILIFLVLISIVLTTRIWLDITTPGIFIMFENKRNAADEKEIISFNNMSLIKPGKMIVNNNGKHSLIFNDYETGPIFNRLMEEVLDSLILLAAEEGTVSYDILSMDSIGKIRSGSNVEIIFPFSYDIQTISSLLKISPEKYSDIDKIDTIIMSFDSNLLYIIDKEENSIYKMNNKKFHSDLKFLSDMLNKLSTYSYVFLNEVDPIKYGEDVLIPVCNSPYKLPKLLAKSEVEDNNSKNIAADFFDVDLNSLRSIVEPNGTIIYTDGTEKGMKIDNKGLIEYVSYSNSEKQNKLNLSIDEQINVGTNFINTYLGFPKDTYISSIESAEDNACTIRYNYTYEGLPIINEHLEFKSPMEIEIVDGRVKKFKRLIRHIKETEEIKNIKNPLDIIDVLYKRLSEKNIEIDHVLIKDIYLAYMEFEQSNDIFMLPVWVIHLTTDKENEGEYMMNAETGVILWEPY